MKTNNEIENQKNAFISLVKSLKELFVSGALPFEKAVTEYRKLVSDIAGFRDDIVSDSEVETISDSDKFSTFEPDFYFDSRSEVELNAKIAELIYFLEQLTINEIRGEKYSGAVFLSENNDSFDPFENSIF